MGLVLCLAVGCSPGRVAPQRITAGGSTFVNPIMQKWAGEYQSRTTIEIDYVSRGSGYGIEQLNAGTIDFACTDVPLSREQMEAARGRGGEVIHVPLITGCVAIVYNLPGVHSPLKLTGEILADIYRKKITRWDDPRLTTLNPGLPAGEEILVVARSEKCGTTTIFTEYLSKVSTAFKTELGTSTKPRWPRDVVEQDQNDGVAGFVSNNEYSLGYVELLYAKRNNLKMALLRNEAGEYVRPGLEGAVAAAEAATKIEPAEEPYTLHDLAFSLTNAPGAQSYPICGISYGIVFSRLSKTKGQIIVNFLLWAVSEGQRSAPELDFAPLPNELQKKAQARLERIAFE